MARRKHHRRAITLSSLTRPAPDPQHLSTRSIRQLAAFLLNLYPLVSSSPSTGSPFPTAKHSIDTSRTHATSSSNSKSKDPRRLNESLKRPRGFLAWLALAAGSRGVPRVPTCAELCLSHEVLDPRVVRSLFKLLDDECSTAKRAAEYSDYSTREDREEVRQWLKRMDGTRMLWCDDALRSGMTGKEKRQILAGGRCEACVFAEVGASAGALTDLRASLRARLLYRQHRIREKDIDSSRSRRRPKRAHEPRLLRLIEAFVDLHPHEVQASIIQKSEGLARVILRVRGDAELGRSSDESADFRVAEALAFQGLGYAPRRAAFDDREARKRNDDEEPLLDGETYDRGYDHDAHADSENHEGSYNGLILERSSSPDYIAIYNDMRKQEAEARPPSQYMMSGALPALPARSSRRTKRFSLASLSVKSAIPAGLALGKPKPHFNLSSARLSRPFQDSPDYENAFNDDEWEDDVVETDDELDAASQSSYSSGGRPPGTPSASSEALLYASRGRLRASRRGPGSTGSGSRKSSVRLRAGRQSHRETLMKLEGALARMEARVAADREQNRGF